MFTIPRDLNQATILISNDDGIHAEGIAILTKVAKTLGADVWVVAPESEQSGAGHSLTIHTPLRVRELGGQHFAVSGTPTDCILLAVQQILPKILPKRPDLVLSGINRGKNTAEDVTYSGTIAAAMEATLLEIPAIAFSQQYHESEPMQWDSAYHWALQTLHALEGFSWPQHTLLSVNIPHREQADVAGIIAAPQGARPQTGKIDARIDPKGRAYYWIGGTGFEDIATPADCDQEQLRKGYVTITPLHLDLTERTTLQALRTQLQAGTCGS